MVRVVQATDAEDGHGRSRRYMALRRARDGGRRQRPARRLAAVPLRRDDRASSAASAWRWSARSAARSRAGPACAFTKPTNPGYADGIPRKQAIVSNYFAHVAERARRGARRCSGPVDAAQGYIREPITGPAVLALFTVGSYDGARLLRSRAEPVGRRQHDPHGHLGAARRRRAVRGHARRGLPGDRRAASATRSRTSRRSSSSASRTTSSAT